MSEEVVNEGKRLTISMVSFEDKSAYYRYDRAGRRFQVTGDGPGWQVGGV
jgi:hypothetical protein